jgi:hypothetical protein
LYSRRPNVRRPAKPNVPEPSPLNAGKVLHDVEDITGQCRQIAILYSGRTVLRTLDDVARTVSAAIVTSTCAGCRRDLQRGN